MTLEERKVFKRPRRSISRLTFLAKLRLQAGYSQLQVAEILFLGQASYSRIEGGGRRIDLSIAMRLAELYKINLGDFAKNYEQSSRISPPPKCPSQVSYLPSHPQKEDDAVIGSQSEPKTNSLWQA